MICSRIVQLEPSEAVIHPVAPVIVASETCTVVAEFEGAPGVPVTLPLAPREPAQHAVARLVSVEPPTACILGLWPAS